MVSLVSRLCVVFLLMFLFVLGLPPVHAVDVDGLDFRVGVGSGVLEDQSYLDNNGEDFVDDDVENVDGVENNSENNIDVVGGLGNENSNVGLDSENNNNNNNFDGGSGLVTENNNNNNIDVVDSLSDVDVFSLNGVSSGVPSVLGFSVSGDFDRSKRGVGFYRNVRVQVTGENFTGDNFLSKEGLHWSNKTRVEPITARKLGVINDPVRFFPQNTPNRPVTAYSMNNGDSGRITFVGKTQSNIDLDIIWTVTSSDKNAWISGSGFNNDGKTKGLGFTGQQYMPNSNGNSIVVLYNQANSLGLHYKIVKHGTDEEVPVLVSFISTDIDAGQGVDTDLDNITRIVPPESNLKIDNNLVYDSTPGVVGLNGSNDLPKGGYVGVGFVSSFNYTFFSPAPRRANEYQYSSAVRYDIFGSSLQANVDSRIIQNLSVEYKTVDGMELSETRITNGFVGDAITSEELTFDGYTLVEKKEDYSVSSYPKIVYVYKKDTKQVTPTKPNNPNNPTVPSKPTTPTKPPVTTKPSNPTTQPLRPQTTTPPRTITRLPQTYVPRTLSPHTPPRQSQHLQPQYKPTPKKQDKGPAITNTYKNERRYGRHDEEHLDLFYKNTGIPPAEQYRLLGFMDAVAKEIMKNPGVAVDTVNREVAKAMADSVYKDTEQSFVISFPQNTPYKGEYRGYGKVLKQLHKLSRYKVDPSHGFATYASGHYDGFTNETKKFLLSCSPYLFCTNNLVVPYRETFYKINGQVGDDLTTINPKDDRANKDMYILRYHPKFRGRLITETYPELYRKYDLEGQVRQKLYDEAKNNNPYDSSATIFAYLSLAGWILINKKSTKGKAKAGQLARADVGIVSAPKSFEQTWVDIKTRIFGKEENKKEFTNSSRGSMVGIVGNLLNNKVAKPTKSTKSKIKSRNTKPKVSVLYTGSVASVVRKHSTNISRGIVNNKTTKHKINNNNKKHNKKTKRKFNSKIWGWR